MESGVYKYVGIDAVQDPTSLDVTLKQDDYKKTLEEIEIDSKDPGNRKLNKQEFNLYHGACGNLSWLVDHTRRDLAYDVIELTRHKKDATVSDMRVIRNANLR